MNRTFARRTRLAVATTLIGATSLAVGVASGPVRAAPPAFTKIPTRLYMVPKEHSMVIPDLLAGLAIPIETMKFADVPLGGDLISMQSRIIEIESSELASCRHHGTNADPGDPADDFDLTGCTALQLEVGNGTLKFMPAPVAEPDPAQPGFNIYRFGSGALLRDADTPDDLERPILALIGTAAEINQTMQTLVYTPTVDDPSTQNVDEDYYYDGSDPEALSVDLVPGDTTEGGIVTKDVDIRVLDYNNFPDVAVPQDQWSTDNTGTDLELFTPDANSSNPPQTPTLEVADEDNDEGIDQAQDGSDANTDPGDGDDPDDGAGDEFLFIAWATCGRFSLWSQNGWAIVDDLADLFDYVYDQAKDPLAIDAADKELVEEAFFALLPDDVEQLPFTTAPPTNMHTAFAGIANSIADLNYAAGRITFAPRDPVTNLPLQDTTCKVRTLVSDLGNNGLPLQYLGDPPAGVEIPMFGVDFDTNYVPAVEELTIDIGSGGPVPPTITSVSDVSLAEGNAGTTPFTFTLSLDSPATGNESVLVSTTHTNGAEVTDLTDDTDLTPVTNQLVSFTAGSSSATVTVPVNGDGTVEADEHFELNLTGAQNVTIGDAKGLGTVQNDDGAGAPPQIDTFTDVTLTEGNAGTKDFTFTIGLSDPAPAGGVSVRVTTHHVSTDGDDLTPLLSQLVTFGAGQDTRTITVKVNGDTTVEPTETFTAMLGNPNGATIAPSAQSATGTITADDFRHVEIDDVTLAEGDVGTTNFMFTLTLDGPAIGIESVLVSTGGGNATAGVDYTSLNNVPVTFAAGDISETVTVLVNGDPDPEPAETFQLNLTTPAGLTIADNQGIGTITNDDAAPQVAVSVNDVSLAEGNAGTTSFTFTLSLDGPAPASAAVDVSTATGTADAADFAALSNVTVPFAMGTTTATVTVLVNGDPDVELDETFTVNLIGPQSLSIGDGEGVGTIQNDDGAQTNESVSINDVTLLEGDAATTAFTFTVTLDAPAEGNESVAVTTNHVSTDGTDLTPLTNQLVTFANAATTAAVTVQVNGDPDVEANETFTVTLSAPQNLLVTDGSGIGTIVNDDAAPQVAVSVNDVSLAEGNAGTTSFTFTLSLDGPAPASAAVDVSTATGTADAADFAALSNVTVPFAMGTTTATVTVLVNGDPDVELDETFTVNLIGPQSLSIGDGEGVGTITNDDAAPTPAVSVNDVSLAEGNAATTSFTFTLSLDNPAPAGTSVDVSTATDTADAADFGALSNLSVPFAIGATTATVTVLVNGDPDVELDEAFFVNLSTPQNVTITDGQGVGTIQNDDGAQAPPQVVDVSDVTVEEGNSGTTSFTFTLTLDKPAGADASVGVSTIHAQTDGSDLTPLTNVTVQFAIGSTTATVTVLVNGDPDVENDETFTLSLSNPANLTIAAAAESATGTIVDDDFVVQPPSPLTITVPADITVPNDPGQAGAAVAYPAPTSNGGVAPVTITCTSPSGVFFPLGPTNVSCTAVDSDPNQMGLALATVSDTFTVTVIDTEPPVINDNPDISRTITGTSVNVTFPLPGTSDNSGVAPTVACSPASGTSFNLGTATVTCTATDGAGNQASSSFTVTVTQSAELPATGGDVRTPLVIAFAATLLGAVLLLQRRRTRAAS